MNDQQRNQVITAVTDAITNQFMAMVPAQPDAQALRALLSEMIETVTLATAALMPGFEDDPAHYIRMGRIGAAPSLEGLLRTVMAPGSRVWSPSS